MKYTATRNIDFGLIFLAEGEIIDTEQHPNLAKACTELAAKPDSPALISEQTAAEMKAAAEPAPTVDQLRQAHADLLAFRADIEAREVAVAEREAAVTEREAAQTDVNSPEKVLAETEAAERTARVQAAVAELMKDPANMTKDSGPKVEAIEKAIGGDVTADERDAAWAAVQEAGAAE